jgi:hypothetical protein
MKTMSERPKKDEVQGEGDHDAARRYNEAGRDFVDSGGQENAPDPAGQPREVADWAERKGKSRAKELDPQVHRDYDQATDK